MRIVFLINTSAQFHVWRNSINNLMDRGHQVQLLVRDYGSTCALLKSYNLQYIVYIRPNKLKYLKGLELLRHIMNAYKPCRLFNSDIVVGFGAVESLTSVLLRRPCVIFTDSEPIAVENYVTRLLASAVVTPGCFKTDLGGKHIRIDGYKELAYLHPNRFTPDPSIYEKLGINKGERYVILRFNAFDAVHDIRKHGFSLSDKYQLVRELEKHARVFISDEGDLPKDLKRYNLPTPSREIHHALYYAQMLVSDTQTMTTEAAVLGTPAVRCNNFVGPNDMGNFIELEQKYDLLYSFREPEQAIRKAVALIQQPDLKERWAEKRQKLLADKIDVTQFMVDFIENYPESFNRLKNRRKS